jgi:Fe-S-cluster-containing dehydrogenase component/anaerobic selenocysteine-containing dehydrogenase
MEKYWRSIEEVETGPVQDEIIKAEEVHKDDVLGMIEGLPFKSGASRRDFLKIMSFSVAGTALMAACKRPVQNAIPFLIQPVDIVPGKASHYASTFFDGSEYCPIVVKVRDGRPIKLDGNDLYTYTRGGSSARVQASILSLYDNARIKSPGSKDAAIPWAEADKEIVEALQKAKSTGHEIVLLSSTIFSPSTLGAIETFQSEYPSTKVVYYDVVSYSGMVDAYKEATGKSGIPYPRFDKAEVIVNFGADFLGSWLLPTEFTLAYVAKRKLERGQYGMSRHIQYESNLSLTGSNADERISIKPSEEPFVLANLYNIIAAKRGAEKIDVGAVSADFKLEKIANELLGKRGKSLVLSGSNDPQVQKIVIAINQLLDNFGNTFDMEKPILLKQGSDAEMFALVERMQAGKVGVVLFYNANPCHDYHSSSEFIKALDNVSLKVSFTGFPNETVLHCDFVCPDHHFLESWNDYEARKGIYSISQPCISHIFDTRPMQESILVWAGKTIKWEEVMKDRWEKDLFPKQKEIADSGSFWVNSLRNGFLETAETEPLKIGNVSGIKELVKNHAPSKALELHMVVPIGVASGFHSNNPWLQELPDPISRVTWDNYASLSPKFAKEMNLKTGDVISIGNKIEIPVVEQPGQAYGVVSIALNYGRTHAGKVAEEVGVDMYSFVKRQTNNLQYYQTDITVRKTVKSVILAQTQTHHTMEGREIIRETTLAQYAQKPNAGNEAHEEFEKKHQTLYPEHQYDSFHWGLGIDLNSCIGCGACTIACQVENNVAVVGKEQVTKRRIMHWIRVDRYYTGAPETPSVLFQPVMCQHCDNAPCENVCPVAATNHSNEGLNQMAYNRCVGTRYCINNCPYKVRRFNWLKFTDNPKFDFNQNSQLGKMVLNPDVVVRERGVVEKCTFCVQRIQEKKLNAKLENRLLKDGEVEPACVQACPSEAMTFGDLNDPHSNIFKLYSNERNYHLLEELHTLPKVGYLTKVRNKEV